MYRRRVLKIDVGKIKVMLLNGEEGLEYEISVDGVCWNLNTWYVLWMNYRQMRQCFVGR